MSCVDLHITRMDRVLLSIQRRERIQVIVSRICDIDISSILFFDPSGLNWKADELYVTRTSVLTANRNWMIEEIL